MPTSLREEKDFCCFGESNSCIDEKKKMRIIDFLRQDSEDMGKIKEGKQDSFLSSSSPRLLLARWFSSLTTRCRCKLASLTASSFKTKKEAGYKVEPNMGIDGSKAVVGSLTRVAPENVCSSEFGLARINNGESVDGKSKCNELMRPDCEGKGKMGNQLLSHSMEEVENQYALPLEDVSKGDDSISDDLKEKKCSSKVDIQTRSAPVDRVLLSGRCLESTSFNLGIGVGLAFFIVRSKNEIDKMIELQKQMEMLLKDIRNEIQRKDVISSSSTTIENDEHSSNSNGAENIDNHFVMQNQGSSSHLVLALTTMKCDQESKFGSATGSTKSIGIDQLEAELEAELERLQHSLDAEDGSGFPGQQSMEVVGGVFSPSFTNEIDPQEHDMEFHGVSPYELEKRLHELLEARQQERIEELESALDCTERLLREKEMEICWWKDSVEFLLQHKC